MQTHFVRDDFPLDAVTSQFILLVDALIEPERGLLDAHKRYNASDYGLVNTGNLQQDLDQIKTTTLHLPRWRQCRITQRRDS